MTEKLTTIPRQFQALIAMLVIAVALIAAPAANAFWPDRVSYTYSNTGKSNLRTCPNTSSTPSCYVIGSVPNYYSVWMLCWTDSERATGNYTSNRWFKVYFKGNDRHNQALIHSSLVHNQAPNTPRC